MQLKRTPFVLLGIFLLASQAGFAKTAPPIRSKEIQKSSKNIESHNTAIVEDKTFEVMSHGNINYLPYLQIGGTRFLSNMDSLQWASEVDLFIPLWQAVPSHLIFTHARLYDRVGTPFEGNIHIGYRYLSEDETKLFGIFGAFDRKRSAFGNYYNQLTFGIENWFDKLYIGANYYQPIGARIKPTGIDEEYKIAKVDEARAYKNILLTAGYRDERILNGGDAEVGYEIVKGLTGYLGGYYFEADNKPTVCGPKAKLAYDYSLDNGKRILGVFDKIGLEAGIQHDKPRGTVGYASLNVQIGLAQHRSTNLQGTSRHMVDLVRRDVDIITVEGVVKRGDPTIARDKGGKEIRVVDLRHISAAKLQEIISDSNTVVVIQGEEDKLNDDIRDVIKNRKDNIIDGSKIEVISPHTGKDISANVRSALALDLKQIIQTERKREEPILPERDEQEQILKDFYNNKDWYGYEKYFYKLSLDQQEKLANSNNPIIKTLENERANLFAEKL